MTPKFTPVEEEIMSDIKARSEAMLSIKTLTLRYTFLRHDKELLLQHSIPMVYSVWEGFVQTVLQIYIRELNKLGLTIDAVCKPILIYHIEAKFKQFKQYPENHKKKALFFDQLNQFYTSKTVYINPIINTESNVGFNTLNRILKEFNLGTIDEYPEPRYSLLEELDKFLKVRNGVAHGQNAIVVNREDLDRAIELINKLMDLVFERIKKGFAEKSYLRDND